ncbi:hypothetical protein [Roseomonas chloroacetimidivorans]|uniref:3'-5' exonuclease n=1 Tax=Roseomonas chloroacetimidivorans TaxID=1766656 RepID=UPI003C774ABF
MTIASADTPPLGATVFLDFEASSFWGWPIEVGLAWCDGPGPETRFRVTAFLIRPEPDWDKADWDPLAEEVHGIALDHLRRRGAPAPDVARAVARLIEGCTVVSDAADFDGALLQRLFEAMPEAAPDVYVLDLAGLLRRLGPEAAARYDAALAAAPAPHRAGPDALRLARGWQAAAGGPDAP